MKRIKRKFEIVSVQVLEGRIILGLKLLETTESKILPEEVIEKLPSSDEEGVALRLAKAMTGEMRRLPGISRPTKLPPIRLELTEEEYRSIGCPTIYQTIILGFTIEVE